MQALKLSLEGSYYDSQIYSRKLHLWEADGSILIIDWDALVEDIVSKADDDLKFTASCILDNSEYLYHSTNRLMFHDKELTALLRKRFDKLQSNPLYIDGNKLERYTYARLTNYFSFPHADSLIFHNQFYVGSRDGIQTIKRDKLKKATKRWIPGRVWDGDALSLAGADYTVAVAGGNDGIFEFNINTVSSTEDWSPTLNVDVNKVRWVYQNIFGSSYKGSYLAIYESGAGGNANDLEAPRRLLDVIPSSQLFTNPSTSRRDLDVSTSFAWGVRDKLCSLHEEQINIMKYSPPNQRSPQAIENLGSISIEGRLNGDVVTADSSVFGYVIETDNGLLVIDSDMKLWPIDNEPVNWRVFPNTKYYANHLHVIYEDHMVIYIFYQDYFVSQSEKQAGITYSKT